MKMLFLFACLTAAVCAAPTVTFKEALTESCKPCDDFFQYVNKKWLDSHPIPAEEPRWGVFNTLNDANRERLRVILDDAVARTKAGKVTRGSDEEKIGAYYSSCMDTAGIEARGTEPVQPYLAAIAAIQDIASLVRAIIGLQEAGVTSPVALHATPDFKNPDEMIAWLSPAAISLPDRDNYFQSDDRSRRMRDEFVSHVARMHRLLGLPDAEAQAAAKTILEFETRLAQPMLTRAEQRDPYRISNRMDLAAVSKLAPSFDWGALLDHFSVARTAPINLTQPKFAEVLEKELAGDLATWRTYLRWRLMATVADELPAAFDQEKFSFAKVLTGVKEQKARWKRCIDNTDQALPDALGRVFIKKHFPPTAKKRMDELVANLRKTLAEELAAANWLSPETRKQALHKLEKIGLKIGYPDKWKDYSTMPVAGGRYFENNRAAVLFALKDDLRKIGKPIDKTEWSMSPPTVNAYYSPLFNEIAFPAGILQPPFFDMDADDAVNYGAIGAVIGHEIGHGFDDKGSQFDANGKLRNWWTDDDRKKFETRVSCIVDQFNSFEVFKGARHNGKLVTGEALGDVGGLTLAYKAYQRSLKGKKAKPLEGFTAEQRFFLSYARIWAQHGREEFHRLRLQTDPHPLPQFRVLETLKNMPEFHQAFGCKQGDAMVRPAEKQCRLW
ncbi:MAG: M13 family metallopeptidase [Bryobacteraceae bacterium]|nr:M13 family metallopeptidase [Bryobacteraceae bacterium]